jgi:hypothetical protein
MGSFLLDPLPRATMLSHRDPVTPIDSMLHVVPLSQTAHTDSTVSVCTLLPCEIHRASTYVLGERGVKF